MCDVNFKWNDNIPAGVRTLKIIHKGRGIEVPRYAVWKFMDEMKRDYESMKDSEPNASR